MLRKSTISKKYFIAFLIFFGHFFIAMSIFPGNDSDDSKKGVSKPISDDKRKISWQKTFKEKDMTVIPGSVMADFGRFELRWLINPQGMTRLITLESSGSAELPLREKKILPMVFEDGVTLLFHEWSPLANAKEPYTIRVITSVPTSELFSILPSAKLPPACRVSQAANPIMWGKVSHKNGIQYLEGTTKASFGTLNILWKKSGKSVPELITLETPGAGELPPSEARLLPWIDETTGTSVICQERHPQINEKFPPYLMCLTRVKTDELISGFKRLIP